MPVQITTSSNYRATSYSNQRKIDRCQNGVLWTIFLDNSASYEIETAYSTNNGATWTMAGQVYSAGGATSYHSAPSLFIDLDDYAHVVYKNASNGYTYYRRGTPNAGRTAWTWSTPLQISAANTTGYVDVIAHREGTGWKVHAVDSVLPGTNYVCYVSLTITSGHVITLDTAGPNGVTSGLGSNGSVIGPQGNTTTGYGHTVHSYPSIDFNHTGDGKTVAGGTPHLYIAWSAGAAGAGKGIRFRKATYSGGSWTWNNEREIDSTRYISVDSLWLNCLFDGTRVIMAALVVTAGSVYDVMLYGRDAADTASPSPITLIPNLANAQDQALWYGSSSYDQNGNVYLFGSNGNAGDLVVRKWTRLGASLGSQVVIDPATPGGRPSPKRGYSNYRLEIVYTDGTASPYSVKHESILLPHGGPRMMV